MNPIYTRDILFPKNETKSFLNAIRIVANIPKYLSDTEVYLLEKYISSNSIFSCPEEKIEKLYDSVEAKEFAEILQSDIKNLQEILSPPAQTFANAQHKNLARFQLAQLTKIIKD